MGMTEPNFEEGWSVLQEEGINKLIHALESGGDGAHQNIFTGEEYMRLYTIVYNLCSPNPIGLEAHKLYDGYKTTFEDYISSKVLPSLRGHRDNMLLQELVRHWKNHRFMVYWLSRFFYYLNRYFTPRRYLPTLQETSHLVFYKLVYGEINDQIRDVVLSLINREREGEEIEQVLLKNVLDIYVEMSEDSTNYYGKDFEEVMFIDTTAFYSRKGLEWIESDNYEIYMLKVKECMKQEKERVSTYRSKHKLLEILQKELLDVHESKLAEMKQLRE